MKLYKILDECLWLNLDNKLRGRYSCGRFQVRLPRRFVLISDAARTWGDWPITPLPRRGYGHDPSHHQQGPSEFAKVLKKVKEGRRFLLERHDKGVAAIVSVEDFALLEAIENRHDLEAARRAMAEVAEKGATPWEDVKRELGL